MCVPVVVEAKGRDNDTGAGAFLMNQRIRGHYRDILTDRRARTRWDSGWRSNLIVQNCNVLLAALLKRQEGMQGILYWAIGQGDGAWDSSCPSPSSGDSRLCKEVARLALAPDRIVYLDDSEQAIASPSDCLEISAEFSGATFARGGSQPLREFGLFGGDATDQPDTGFMIDYVIHPCINLTPDWTLHRKLRLAFGAVAIPQEYLTGFGSTLPVSSIDGIGPGYASDLLAQGIQSIGELGEIDPLQSLRNIPPVKLREFCAKARLVTRLHVNPAPFAPLAERSISSLLSERPEVIVSGLGGGVTLGLVTQFQDELAMLQIALDDTQLQHITLGSLIRG